MIDEDEENACKRQRQNQGEPVGDPAEDATLDTEAENKTAETDDAFFEAYDDLSIHALMLGDQPRVGAYSAAIRLRRSAIEGKVVLDVGAGSGVLSLLAAKLGGAARVYAVEATPGIACIARTLAAQNGLDDIVKIVEGRVEEIELPEKVDVIISEWMGFYLIHESMLESVLNARDHWLKPGGVMLPGSARIWAALVEAEELRKEIEGYKNLHGLDLSLVGTAELSRRCAQPQVEIVEPSRLLTSPIMVHDLGDLHTLRPGETAEIISKANFIPTRSGRAAGIAFWFDVGFGEADRTTECSSSLSRQPSQEIMLLTGPGAPPTHWKQTIVHFGAFVPVDAGDTLPANLTFRRNADNHRQYDISVET